jgi:hypothetical protein
MIGMVAPLAGGDMSLPSELKAVGKSIHIPILSYRPHNFRCSGITEFA